MCMCDLVCLCITDNAFAFVYKVVPTRINMLGIIFRLTSQRPWKQQPTRGKTLHLVRNLATVKPVYKNKLVKNPKTQKTISFKTHSHEFVKILYFISPLCSFHIGLVLQMMQRKEERQSVRGYKVLEVEALKIQSPSIMFNTYKIQMK